MSGRFFRTLALLALLLTWLGADAAAARPVGQTTHRAAARKKAKRRVTARRPTAHRVVRRRYPAKRYAKNRRYSARVAYQKPKMYPPPDSTFRAQYPNLPTDFQPAFMRPDLNRIETFSTGPEALQGFRKGYEALAAGQARQLHILHLGDSHMQADMLSGRARDLWQDPALGGLGAAGRGLIFPYTLARTNNPWNYRVTTTGAWQPHRSAIPAHAASWGVTGMAATTTMPGVTFTVQLTGATAARSPMTRVRVFYPVEDSASFALELLDSANIARQTLSAAGGFAEWTLRSPATAVAFQVKQTRPQQRYLTVQGLSLDNEQSGVTYSAVGGNGATVESYLRCGRLRQQVAVLKPDLVIISLGTNDVFGPSFDSVAFRRSYATLLMELIRAAPRASILLTTPGETFRNGRPNGARTATATRIIRQLADEAGVSVWDFFAVMGGTGSIRDWNNVGLAQRDYVHYTLRGYQLQADLLTQALRTALREGEGPVAPLPLPVDPK
jgi:lysophospholipase L1-like esterase